MSRIDKECLKQVSAALEDYRKEVENSSLRQDTKRTYMRHAETFVRWLDGDFEPGGGQQQGDIYA